MAEVLHKDDSEQEIRNAFGVFDKDDTGLLPIQEMRHVFTRIGDQLTQEEVDNFVAGLDNYKDGFIRIQDVVNMFLPQTHKDVYAKSVGDDKPKAIMQ